MGVAVVGFGSVLRVFAPFAFPLRLLLAARVGLVLLALFLVLVVLFGERVLVVAVLIELVVVVRHGLLFLVIVLVAVLVEVGGIAATLATRSATVLVGRGVGRAAGGAGDVGDELDELVQVLFGEQVVLYECKRAAAINALNWSASQRESGHRPTEDLLVAAGSWRRARSGRSGCCT